ncbi:MAG: hypothetical protein ACOY0T_22525 [Myxococcota bacterium]
MTDIVEVIPGKVYEGDPKAYENLENHGVAMLRGVGASLAGSGRVRMFDLDAVEVTGDIDETRISIRILYRGRRRFEFRCIGIRREAGWPCESAFTAFRIRDLPEVLRDTDSPRVLRLREPSCKLAFDAPDDSWRGIGPRTGGGGAQRVWVWNKEDRQIDVQVIDLTATSRKPSEAVLANAMADELRARGDTVVVNTGTLAGRPCQHLSITRRDGWKQDLFVLIENDVSYGLMITQQTRDLALVDAAKKGFRLTTK